MPRTLHALLAAPALAACSDYGIEEIKDPSEGGEAVDTGGVHGEMTDTAALCGTADDLATEVVYDETCIQAQVTGTLDAVVEWEATTLSNYGEYDEILMAPVVGLLNDDGVPDIVVITDDGGVHEGRGGILRVFTGDGSGASVTLQQAELGDLRIFPYRYSNAALGDVDGDGEPEIVLMVDAFEIGGGGDDTGGGGGIDTGIQDTGGGGGGGDDTGGTDNPVEPGLPAQVALECHVAVANAQGTFEWVADDTIFDCGGHAPALADLEGDGTVEIIVGPDIFEGATGALRAVGSSGTGRTYAFPEIGLHSVVADLDGDGFQEVVAGRTLYSWEGTELCSADVVDGFAAVADFDLDGDGEVVVVGDGTVAHYDAACSALASWSLSGGGNGGPPTIGDFDADGVPEIGVADAGAYAVYEGDGTLVWSMPVTDDSSQATGSVIFDFEGDGYPEVVYADETRLWVFDGATGTVRYEDAAHASRTLHDFPTVADVDADGQSEIVVVNGGGHRGEDLGGLYVLGGADGWSGSREVWNQHAYSITNVNDDLSIPAVPVPNWPEHNNFRSGDLAPVNGGLSPDAVPLAEVCTVECGYGRVYVAARVGNSGAGTLRSGLPVSVYTVEDGFYVLLGTGFTEHTLAPGAVSEQIRFELAMDDVVDGQIVVIADDDGGVGYVMECRELNNEVELEGVECPTGG